MPNEAWPTVAQAQRDVIPDDMTLECNSMGVVRLTPV